ncbi:hypothetical protein MMC22_009949 [Lobaria immixta]|nr:hypothetical protein [Lobaria immixta]
MENPVQKIFVPMRAQLQALLKQQPALVDEVVQEALDLCLLATGDAAFDKKATRGKKYSDLTPVHFWQNKVLVLSPTAAQYRDFPTFLESAEALDKHGVGAILVNAHPSMEEEMPLTLKSFPSTECLQYEVRRRQGGIFEVQLPFCSDVLNPVRSSSVDPGGSGIGHGLSGPAGRSVTSV